MPTRLGYEEVYRESIENPEIFWGKEAEQIDWYTKWTKVLDDTNAPFYKWFVGGKMNTCYNAVDRHIEKGYGQQTAIIYDSPVTQKVEKISYLQLQERVSLFAGMLKKYGVEKGDTVIIYMPMIPESLYAMLGCARIGAIHSVVFGGFAPQELAVRIDDAKPKLVVSTSCGIEGKKVIPYKPLLDEALRIAQHQPETCIIFQRPQVTASLVEGRDYDWANAIKEATAAECTPLEATDPLYILYTSGTTGKPKGVVRDNGGYSVALHWSMSNIYDTERGEVFWAASDVGWVVGHSYIVYAPLLKGCTTVVYEGKPVGTPDAGAFWRVIAEHGVSTLFTAPTAIRAIRKEDPEGSLIREYNISSLRNLFLAGERLDPETYHWASEKLQTQVIDHWWQTETGWAIAANCIGIETFPIKVGSPTKPVPGYKLLVVDGSGEQLAENEDGHVVIQLPLPPGCLQNLWNDDKRYLKYMTEIEGFYNTGDGGHFDEEGYLFIMGRMDDVINVAGHRLSTGAMEEIVAKHADIAECAVIGAKDSLKGEVPIGFAVLKKGRERDGSDLEKEVVSMIRSQLGAVACFKNCMIVSTLPKTRSGKILRATMRQIVNGEKYTIPATIEDEEAVTVIEEVTHTMGIKR